MRVFKIILHSLILAAVNIVSIIFGFGIYHFFTRYNQMTIQVPIAAIFSIIVFTTWIVIIKYKNISKIFPEGWLQFLLVFLFSLAWILIIFVPLNYITQGYLTSFGNIYLNWIFQIPTNIVIILISYFIISSKPKKK
ncbi:MAG: hypothetical protein A2163_11195 [Actinobacteria bacterium RBG_13_35_12]|nr:MAG: hypothetical protein A2163_11195 [Actinobacteria bacterium RBG_13_35_12]